MIRPFFAAAPQEVITDLKERIRNTRWPDAIKDSGWSYGSDPVVMKDLAEYWLNSFDWRRVEAHINSFPNYIAEIQGQQIHFIHVKGKGRTSVPLIITHGWPGSFLELLKLVPLLTGDEEFSFDLVIPSVIGFGYSGKCTHEGCNSQYAAGLWNRLMGELGYERYGVQGGDIGAGISTWLSLQYPERIIGLHLNYIPGSYSPYPAKGEQEDKEVIRYREKAAQWLREEGAYAHQHSTKPQTLAYGLNDSPIGLCAWIIEKFSAWSDNGGDIRNSFTYDELLANVTLYWVTQTINSSMRMYSENSIKPLALGKDDLVRVPVAFASFPGELPTPPRSYVEKGYNIVRWTQMQKGGHFAAAEQPELLAADIRSFFLSLARPYAIGKP